MPGRNQADREARGEGHQQSEPERAKIEMDRFCAGHSGREAGRQRLNADRGHHPSAHRREEREHQPLRHQETGQAAPAGAQRGAHREFLVPLERSCQLEPADIDGRDHEQDRHREEQRDERSGHRLGHCVLDLFEPEARRGVLGGMGLDHSGGNQAQLGLDRGLGGARIPAGDHLEVLTSPTPVRYAPRITQDPPDPGSRLHHVVIPGRQHSRHQHLARAEQDLPPHDRRIAAEPGAPEFVREDHHAVAVGIVFVGAEVAAQHGVNAQNPEVAGGNPESHQDFRAVVAHQGRPPPSGCGNASQGVGLFPDVLDRFKSESAGKIGRSPLRNHVELIGGPVGKRAENDRVCHAEDRGRGADPEAECCGAGQREGGHPPQCTGGPAQVFQESDHESVSGRWGCRGAWGVPQNGDEDLSPETEARGRPGELFHQVAHDPVAHPHVDQAVPEPQSQAGRLFQEGSRPTSRPRAIRRMAERDSRTAF